MFKVTKLKKVTWPVTVQIPEDGGKVKKATFDGEFQVISSDEQNEAINEGKDLAHLQFVGWTDSVKDDDGQPLPFTEENKKMLLGITYVKQGVYVAIGEIQQGRAAARKN